MWCLWAGYDFTDEKSIEWIIQGWRLEWKFDEHSKRVLNKNNLANLGIQTLDYFLGIQ